MPLQTETIDLADEQASLQAEMEETAEEQVQVKQQIDDADGEAQALQSRATSLLERGSKLDGYRRSMEWAQEVWDAETITLAGLTAGELNRVEDTVEEHSGVRERDAIVAAGTTDAPYLAHDPENVDREAFEETVVAVCDCAPAFVRWAEERVSELSHLEGGTGNGYLSCVRAKQRDG